MKKILKVKNERLQSLYTGDIYFTPHIDNGGFAYNCEHEEGVKISSARIIYSSVEDLEAEALKLIEDPDIVGVTNTGYVVYWD